MNTDKNYITKANKTANQQPIDIFNRSQEYQNIAKQNQTALEAKSHETSLSQTDFQTKITNQTIAPTQTPQSENINSATSNSQNVQPLQTQQTSIQQQSPQPSSPYMQDRINSSEANKTSETIKPKKKTIVIVSASITFLILTIILSITLVLSNNSNENTTKEENNNQTSELSESDYKNTTSISNLTVEGDIKVGFLIVENENGKKALYKTDGTKMTEFYDDLKIADCGVLIVKNNEQYSIMDMSENLIVDFGKYQEMSYSQGSDFILAKNEEGYSENYYLLNNKGEVVREELNNAIYSYDTEYIIDYGRNRIGLIGNHTAKTIIEVDDTPSTHTNYKYTPMTIKNKTFFINNETEEVIDETEGYWAIPIATNENMIIENDQKYILYNKNGEKHELKECDRIDQKYENIICKNSDTKEEYLINENGDKALKITPEGAVAYFNKKNYAKVSTNKIIFYVDGEIKNEVVFEGEPEINVANYEEKTYFIKNEGFYNLNGEQILSKKEILKENYGPNATLELGKENLNLIVQFDDSGTHQRIVIDKNGNITEDSFIEKWEYMDYEGKIIDKNGNKFENDYQIYNNCWFYTEDMKCEQEIKYKAFAYGTFYNEKTQTNNRLILDSDGKIIKEFINNSNPSIKIGPGYLVTEEGEEIVYRNYAGKEIYKRPK